MASIAIVIPFSLSIVIYMLSIFLRSAVGDPLQWILFGITPYCIDIIFIG